MPAAFDLDTWANLGNILVRRGALTRPQLQRLVDEQHRRHTMKIGELAVELKLCSQADIDAALSEQEAHRVPCGPSDTEQRASLMLSDSLSALRGQLSALTTKRAARTMEIPISPEPETA